MRHERKVALIVGLCIATFFSVTFWVIAGLYPEGDPFFKAVLTLVLPLACYLVFPWIAYSFTIY